MYLVELDVQFKQCLVTSTRYYEYLKMLEHDYCFIPCIRKESHNIYNSG